MKYSKRLMSALIVSAMITLSAAGCSGQQEENKPKENSSTVASAATSDSDGSASPETDVTADTYSESVKGISPDTVTNAARETADIAGEAPAFATEKTERTTAADDDTVIADPPEGTASEAPVEPDVRPEAGLLTAGEWNDNSNWGFFTNLVNSDRITFPSFNIDPRFRTAVTVSDKDGKPVMNAAARLIDAEGKIIWEAVTGKDGAAYLFGQNESDGVKIEIESKGKKQEYEIEKANTDTQSVVKSSGRDISVTFDGEHESYKKTDVMFILDTTGSMGDEMLFLQSEFTAITNAAGTDNTRYSINFYRDDGDDYVVKCNDFTDDVSSLQKKLNAENAAGGGDLPEAVDQILQETIYKSSWQDDSVKLAFLIFDAPPHEEKAAETAAAIKEAAKKGIRIIPVVSSNSDRDTELFGRAAAITTGGTYVFLTDDSGIGESHLEPIIGDYKVEKLYDIIIRVINDYKQ